MNFPAPHLKSNLAHSVLGQAQGMSHPLLSGALVSSPGGHFTYRIVGPCCRLYDREQLPWPCCRIEWRSKEPSWRRIGKRFVPDMATRNSPSYSVEIVGAENKGGEPLVVTLYPVRLSPEMREWWHSKQQVS